VPLLRTSQQPSDIELSTNVTQVYLIQKAVYEPVLLFCAKQLLLLAILEFGRFTYGNSGPRNAKDDPVWEDVCANTGGLWYVRCLT
jgi:hypothetical protein